jgi:hypothetical protein
MLLLEILNLLNYRIGIDKIALISHKTGERMSISSMCEEYEKNTMLNRYFSIPKFSSFRSEVFGIMKYLGEIHQKTNEELSNQDKFVYVRQLEIEDSGFSGKNSAGIQAAQVTLDAEQHPQHIKNDYETYEATTKKKIDKIIDSSNSRKHDIYWSGSQWYCNNCKEHGDKPHIL